MSKPATLISVHPGGQVVWGRTPPAGALVIASAARYRDARTIVQVTARKAYDGKRYLCPGVPEAENEKTALAAAKGWRDWICQCHPAALTPIEPPYVQGEGGEA
ncbi:hypothetical protein [Zavarzinia aquatilis]|uniref:Uncharacterized protein n=1 Tax=Zavarzinia aquatilis TaxID=2211142 RepID=A0A317DSL5_9PROT|nr:hypothetical protein [Zavarzinia aquatilis]PWR17668.1 hypothetical protein DKG74_20895 [Zavarzinia aquatilis]